MSQPIELQSLTSRPVVDKSEPQFISAMTIVDPAVGVPIKLQIMASPLIAVDQTLLVSEQLTSLVPTSGFETSGAQANFDSVIQDINFRVSDVEAASQILPSDLILELQGAQDFIDKFFSEENVGVEGIPGGDTDEAVLAVLTDVWPAS